MASSRLRSALLLHAVLALVVVLVVGAKVMNRKYLPGGGDQSRYAAMGLNLADFGVLSGDDPQHRRPPVPGNGVGGPAIALELALVAKLSADTKAGMFCSIEKPVIDA